MKAEASIRHTDNLLQVENRLFTQRWDLRSGVPQLIYFALGKDAPLVDAVQATTGGSQVAEQGVAECPQAQAVVRIERKRLLPCEAVSTHAYLSLTQADGSLFRYHFQVFDSVAGCIVRALGTTDSSTQATDTLARAMGGTACVRADAADATVEMGGIELDPPATPSAAAVVNEASAREQGELGPIVFARPHLLLTQVHFAEQTDRHSEFVFERTQQLHPSERGFGVDVNVLLLEDPATAEGVGLVLLAPSALVRGQWQSKAGYFIESLRPGLVGAGSLAKLVPTLEHYPLAVVGWRGGRDGATGQLHALQQAMHVWQEGRDGLFLSNTWGDRGRGDRICEAFVQEEIAIAERLGTDVVELDDGWQSGLTANTKTGQAGVWNGFWASAPDFWEPNAAAFPHGIGAVISVANKKGIRFGLWFAPDSSQDFANWEKDAQVLLDFWRKYGVCYFKLDAIKLSTLRGEHNLYQLLRRVQEGSHGELLLDMDLTAEYRLAYWGSIGGSTLFLQNRYTDWSNYYPHQTLRALWSLSAYVLPSRLRLEVLNPERNADLYGSDPLRPAAYPAEYLMAITLPASGLGWFEHSGLSERVLESWAALLAIWKAHRANWHSGHVRRIGCAPNGYSWSGFVSLSEHRLYLLVFREQHAEGTQEFKLPSALMSEVDQSGESTVHAAASPKSAAGGVTHRATVSGDAAVGAMASAPATSVQAQRLAGVGDAVLDGRRLKVTIPQRQRFLLACVCFTK